MPYNRGMAATNQQVQIYVDARIRPLCEMIRSLELACADAIATIDDVYQNLANSPTWQDGRTDGPPHLLQPSDVLAMNTMIHDLLTAIQSDAQYAIMRKACVRTVLG